MRVNRVSNEEAVLEVDLDDLVLTTVDNPFNPKEDYLKWKQFDTDNNYNTEEYLARIADIPGDIDLDYEPLIEKLRQEAIQSILEHDILGIYKLV